VLTGHVLLNARADSALTLWVRGSFDGAMTKRDKR
jgi:hypothetical protein